MITAGVDIGAVSAKTVIFTNKIVSFSNILSRGSSEQTSRKALDVALAGTELSLDDISYVVSTGYGRVIVPYTNRNLSEVSCHARGAHWISPEVRTIVDAGGEDLKVIHCNERGKVVNFSVSDKCAAGCGRFVEIMADLFSVSLEDLGKLALQIKEVPPVLTSSCALFAKTEALELLREGVGRNELIAAFCNSIARILANQVRRIGVKEKLMLTGGLSKNTAVVKELKRLLDVEAFVYSEPQIVGALGAAVFAKRILGLGNK